MARTPFVVLNGLGDPIQKSGVDSGDGSIADNVHLLNADGTDVDLTGLLSALSRVDIAASGTLNLTATGNTVSAAVLGRGTATFEIGTPGSALGGSGALAFEAQRTVGGGWTAVSAFPAGGGYKVKSTAVGGVWTVEAAGVVAVRVRSIVVGTGTVAVAIGLSGLTRVQSVVPVEVGQTTRVYDWTNGQAVAVGASDQASAAIAANEVLVHAKNAAMWIRANSAANASAPSMPLEAGEKFHLQISPGDVIHAIQDTAGGTLIILPVA